MPRPLLLTFKSDRQKAPVHNIEVLEKTFKSQSKPVLQGKKQIVPETWAPDADSGSGTEEFSTVKQICGLNRHNVAVGIPLSIPHSI